MNCPDPVTLLSTPKRAEGVTEVPPSCVPLIAAVQVALMGGEPVSNDLVAAARQSLLAHYGEGAYDLVIDVAESLSPESVEWSRSFEATSKPGGGLAVRARRWQPTWLTNTSADPSKPVWMSEVRRRPSHIVADPFFQELLGYETYSDTAQRDAIYSILLAPREATHIVILPTGSGKTSVALTPSLLWARRGSGTAIFVVPTVTLALDLEARARILIEKLFPTNGEIHLAYLGGDKEAATRQGIRNRLHDGSQIVVFTTPESLLGSLRPSLYIAAGLGRLTCLVVDEAHVIGDWGTEFRPEFQSIAGLRRGLLAECNSANVNGFATLLLTATLTQENLRTLVAHFSGASDDGPMPPLLAASVVIRPEPAYWFHACDTEEQRRARLMELVAYLPRPLVVYTTTRRAAYEVHNLLVSAGYSRVGVVTGDTGPEGRSAVLEGLRAELARSRVDIVVATSAFGLGIDNPHIRSIVHACVPESIDRLYQEVGRAGRDGAASISILLAIPNDWTVAERIGRKKIITTERARERWLGLMAEVRRTSPESADLVTVNLPSRPADLVWDSDLNEDWNVRVLNLMARAGYVELHDERPKKESGAPEDRSSVQTAEQVLRVLRNDLSDREAWKSFDDVRARARSSELESLERVSQLTQGADDVAAIFADAYRIKPENGLPYDVVPQMSCGGCASCRVAMTRPYEGTAPVSELNCRLSLQSGAAEFFSRFGSTVIVTYRVPVTDRERYEWIRDCKDLAREFVLRGLPQVLLPASLHLDDFRALHRIASGGFVLFGAITEWRRRQYIPSVIFLDQNELTHLSLEDLLDAADRTPRILVVPKNTPDPVNPQSTLEVMRAPTYAIRALLERL